MSLGTGADLERSSLDWVDKLTELGNGTSKRNQAVLIQGVEQILRELRTVYNKLTVSEGARGGFEARQLQARLSNISDLLPKATRTKYMQAMKQDLAAADALGRESGVRLTEILRGTSDTIKDNAKPNVPGIDNAGNRLSQFWDRENQSFRDRVQALTQNALAQGMSWRKLSLQVRELLNLERAQGTESDRSRRVNQRLGINSRAELIARTELATAMVQGQIAQYREMGYAWARWSAAAERTCGYCMSRDGLVYRLEDIESAIPAHPRCRCSIIPADPPDGFEKKKEKAKGEQASDRLDDLYWTRSREAKLNQWKKENRGLRDPKTDAILNGMLRKLAETPTNTQKFLRPGQPAPKPVWTPSGDLIPNLAAAVAYAKLAQEAAGEAAKQAKLKEEADKAAKALEKKKAEEAKRKEQEEAEQLRAAEEQWARAQAKVAELSKKYKLPPETIQRAMNEARKQARFYGADKQASFELLIKQAQAALKAAGSTEPWNASDHYIKTKSKQRVDAKMIQDSFDLHRKMPGLAGENFRKLEQFMNKSDIQLFFTNPSNNPKNMSMKKYNQMKEDWEVMRNSPNFKRMVEKNEEFWNRTPELQAQFGSNNRSWQRDATSENPYSARAFMTGGVSKAAGFTSGGSNMIGVADWSGFKPVTEAGLAGIRDRFKKNFERRDNDWKLPWSAGGDVPLGAKMGSRGQYGDGWMKTLVHEIGHQVHYRGGLKRLDGKNIDPGPYDPSRKNVKGEWEASVYGSSNQLENFAETFTLWVYQPELLKKYSPEAYKWIDDHVRNALGDTWR